MPAPRKYVDRPAPTGAERQQRSRMAKRARGEQKTEVWFSSDELALLKHFAEGEGLTINEAVRACVVLQLRSASLKRRQGNDV